MSHLIKIVEHDLAEARDNLLRARSAAARRDPSLEWGESGRTLNEIIVGYEKWEREALEALEQARRIEEKS